MSSVREGNSITSAGKNFRFHSEVFCLRGMLLRGDGMQVGAGHCAACPCLAPIGQGGISEPAWGTA